MRADSSKMHGWMDKPRTCCFRRLRLPLTPHPTPHPTQYTQTLLARPPLHLQQARRLLRCRHIDHAAVIPPGQQVGRAAGKLDDADGAPCHVKSCAQQVRRQVAAGLRPLLQLPRLCSGCREGAFWCSGLRGALLLVGVLRRRQLLYRKDPMWLV